MSRIPNDPIGYGAGQARRLLAVTPNATERVTLNPSIEEHGTFLFLRISSSKNSDLVSLGRVKAVSEGCLKTPSLTKRDPYLVHVHQAQQPHSKRLCSPGPINCHHISIDAYSNNRFSGSITLYDINFNNRVVSIDSNFATGIDYLSHVVSVWYNIGGVKSSGVEVAASYSVTPELQVSTAYSYNRAKYQGTGDAVRDAVAGITPGVQVGVPWFAAHRHGIPYA